MEEIVKALILGILQGITEFLPISSSGHLNLVNTFLDLSSIGTVEFSLVVHIATVLSTTFVFRAEISSIIKEFLSSGFKEYNSYVYLLGYSAIPLLPILLIPNFMDTLELYFDQNLLLTSFGFLISALLLLFLDKAAKSNTKQVGVKESFLIGIAQLIAILPGISRSGATIGTGMLLGVKKEKAAKFAFLMLIFPLLGAGLIDFIAIFNGESNASASFLVMSVGFISAFITGIFACKVVISLVEKSKLSYFSYYLFFIALVTFSLHFL